MARRREAFLASERQRVGAPAELEANRGAATIAPSVGNIYARSKSMTMAYLIWFLLGQTGAHRFYLGRMTSGAIQLGLWVVNITLMLSMNPLSIFGLIVAGIWVIGDAFLIPGMVRETNGALRPSQVAQAFA
ncbi:MAG: TM2 domain-containing protein [Sphingomonadaceae bacterium]|nr:TM2 domain-containing protein [Sphingomonadaceae bacterium]